jgi:hypothetical protein
MRRPPLDQNGLRVSTFGDQEGVQADRESAVPFDALEVSREGHPHRDLARGREVDELAVPGQEELPAGGTELLPEQELVDLQLALGVRKCLADGDQKNTMLGSKRPQHVGLDEVGKGEGRGVLLGELQDRCELAEPARGRVGPSEYPGAQRGGRYPQMAAGFGDRVRGLVP